MLTWLSPSSKCFKHKNILYWLTNLLHLSVDFVQFFLKSLQIPLPTFKNWICEYEKAPTLSELATYICNLEVAFDPKSAFNYHCSYIGWKNDSIISRTQQGCDQYYLMSTVILRLLLLIIVGLL